MRCDEARRALDDARYLRDADGAEHARDVRDRETPELRAHLSECAACSALSAQHAELDRMLALDQPVSPRPGFDTRFFARLAEERAQPRMRRRRWFWVLAPLGAGALSLLLLRSSSLPPPASAPPIVENTVADVRQVPPDDLALAMDLEMVENLDVLKKLDELEDFDVLSELDEDDIARLAQEAN